MTKLTALAVEGKDVVGSVEVNKKQKVADEAVGSLQGPKFICGPASQKTSPAYIYQFSRFHSAS